jgi:hypothetical protein
VSHAKLLGRLGVAPTFDHGDNTLMPHVCGGGNMHTPIVVTYSYILNAFRSRHRHSNVFLYLVYAYPPLVLHVVLILGTLGVVRFSTNHVESSASAQGFPTRRLGLCPTPHRLLTGNMLMHVARSLLRRSSTIVRSQPAFST